MENGTSMNCPKCSKIIPITKPLEAKEDTVICAFCQHVISTETIVWADGKFHFRVMGDVTSIRVQPRVLMDNQAVSVFDAEKILKKAKKIIFEQPNLKCICGEFQIRDSHIRIELLPEKTNETSN